jgi:hypothetical protein
MPNLPGLAERKRCPQQLRATKPQSKHPINRMRPSCKRSKDAQRYTLAGHRSEALPTRTSSSRPPRRFAAHETLHPCANVPRAVTTALSFGAAFRWQHDRAHHLALIISQLHRSRFSIDVGMPQDAERKSLRAHDIQGASIVFNAIAHWSSPPDAIPGVDASYHHALGGRALGPA